MIHFRLPFAVFSLWLFALLAFERLMGVNITPTAYVFTMCCGLAVLLTPYLARLGIAPLLLPPLSLLLILKFALGSPMTPAELPPTLIEFSALAVTILLARWTARGFEELQAAVFCNLVSDLRNRTQPFENGQGDLYREVRRARLFERPLAFLAVAPAPGAVEAAKDRFTREVMQRMLHRYVSARLADLFSRRLKDCDVIAQRNSHFVMALPETSRETAVAISRQLQNAARDELGIELKFGVCTCPDEEATFVGLLERAEEKMRRSSESDPLHPRIDSDGDHSGQPVANGSLVVEQNSHRLQPSNAV